MVLTLRTRENDRILREPKRMQLLANSDEEGVPFEAAKMEGVWRWPAPRLAPPRRGNDAANFCGRSLHLRRQWIIGSMDHHPVPGAD
jgi:hypothetical protein